MSSTVTLLKTSAITAITADLTAAVASSASAASSSASAASSSASAASSSATAAASSAASASSSAASAANAIANTYKGGVAGGSVPATSALAGDYYRITAEGTAQSKTWAAGDLAIYNGTSGSWTQIVGYNVDLATLAAQRNALAPAQALSGNGTAGSTLTLASVPSGDQTWAFDIDVPASAPSAANGIYNAGGDFSGANTFGAYIAPTTGILYLNQYAASAPNFRQAVTASSIVTTYGGTRIRCVIAIASGVLTLRINDVAQTLTETTGGTPPAWGATLASGVVFVGKLSSANYYFSGAIRLLGIENYALSTAQQTYVYQTGSWPAADFGQGVNDSGTTVYAGAQMINGANSTFASDSGWWTMTGGTNIAAGVANFVASSTISRASILTIGKRYRATFTLTASGGTFKVQDGASFFLTGLTTGAQSFEFTAAGTSFGISSVGATGTVDNLTITPLGLLVAHDWSGYTGGPQVIDVSGNGADLNLPGDGVSSGVVPTLPGATPSPFRATRTSSGYLIGDQVVIPPGCSVEIWAKGNGTFSLGDSSGTPASIVNAQTAPTNLSPITQAGYVTATRKLYLTLGTATSVTVRVIFHAA